MNNDDWDAVSSSTEDIGATDFGNAVRHPQRPPVKRQGISGSSIAIIVLSVAVIGLSVLTGLSIFHVVNFTNFNIAASANGQSTSVAVNANLAATVQAEATSYAISSKATAAAQPSGTYLSTQGCPTTGSNFWIVNARTGLVIDVSGGSKDSGGAVIQYPDDGGLNQLWQFEPVGTGGYFKIVNVNSGLVLDEPGGSQTSGIAILQYPDNGGGLNQQWQCVSIGSNYFKIVNANSGLILDVANTNLTQIAPLLQDSYAGGLNQQWLFVS